MHAGSYNYVIRMPFGHTKIYEICAYKNIGITNYNKETCKLLWVN